MNVEIGEKSTIDTEYQRADGSGNIERKTGKTKASENKRNTNHIGAVLSAKQLLVSIAFGMEGAGEANFEEWGIPPPPSIIIMNRRPQLKPAQNVQLSKLSTVHGYRKHFIAVNDDTTSYSQIQLNSLLH